MITPSHGDEHVTLKFQVQENAASSFISMRPLRWSSWTSGKKSRIQHGKACAGTHPRQITLLTANWSPHDGEMRDEMTVAVMMFQSQNVLPHSILKCCVLMSQTELPGLCFIVLSLVTGDGCGFFTFSLAVQFTKIIRSRSCSLKSIKQTSDFRPQCCCLIAKSFGLTK